MHDPRRPFVPDDGADAVVPAPRRDAAAPLGPRRVKCRLARPFGHTSPVRPARSLRAPRLRCCVGRSEVLERHPCGRAFRSHNAEAADPVGARAVAAVWSLRRWADGPPQLSPLRRSALRRAREDRMMDSPFDDTETSWGRNHLLSAGPPDFTKPRLVASLQPARALSGSRRFRPGLGTSMRSCRS
jgi:hypothetical protein